MLDSDEALYVAATLNTDDSVPRAAAAAAAARSSATGRKPYRPTRRTFGRQNSREEASVASAQTVPTSNTSAAVDTAKNYQDDDAPVIRKPFRPKPRNFGRNTQENEPETTTTTTETAAIVGGITTFAGEEFPHRPRALNPEVEPVRQKPFGPARRTSSDDILEEEENKHVRIGNMVEEVVDAEKLQLEESAKKYDSSEEGVVVAETSNNSNVADSNKSSNTLQVIDPIEPEANSIGLNYIDADLAVAPTERDGHVEVDATELADEKAHFPQKLFTPTEDVGDSDKEHEETGNDVAVEISSDATETTAAPLQLPTSSDDSSISDNVVSEERKRFVMEYYSMSLTSESGCGREKEEGKATEIPAVRLPATMPINNPCKSIPPITLDSNFRTNDNNEPMSSAARPQGRGSSSPQKRFTTNKAPRRRYSSSSSSDNDEVGPSRSSQSARIRTNMSPTEKVRDAAPRLMGRRGSHLDGSESDSDHSLETKLSNQNASGVRTPQKRKSNSVGPEEGGEGKVHAEDNFSPAKRKLSKATSETGATDGTLRAPKRRSSNSDDDEKEGLARIPFIPRNFGSSVAPTRASADSDDSDDGAARRVPSRRAKRHSFTNSDAPISAQRRLRSLVETDRNISQTHECDDAARAPPQRTASKCLRVTPERATSFSRQAPGRLALPYEEGDSITLLQRTMPGSVMTSGRTVSMNATGLSSLRVQRMESNSGLRQMASAVNSNGNSVPRQSSEPRRNVPVRTISAKASRVTPERSASLRRQISGRTPADKDVSQREVTVLELGEGRSAPLRAASMNISSTRQLPRRTSSVMRRQAPGLGMEGSSARERAGLLSAMARSTPMRAASMNVASERRTPVRTISSLRRQALAETFVRTISEESGEDENTPDDSFAQSPPAQSMRSEITRCPPSRTASSMRRQRLADSSVAPISETLEVPSALEAPLRSANSMRMEKLASPQRRAPMRTASSMRRQRLADDSVAPIKEDQDEGIYSCPPGVPGWPSAPSIANVGRSLGPQQRQAPLRTASSMRRQQLADSSVAAISEDGQVEDATPRMPTRSSLGAESMVTLQRNPPMRTASSLRRQMLTEASVASISEDGQDEDATSWVASMGTVVGAERKAPMRTASSLRRQRLADISVAPISEDLCEESPSRISMRPAPGRAASSGAAIQRKTPMRTMSALRRQELAKQSVAPIGEDEELACDEDEQSSLMRSVPPRAASMSVANAERTGSLSAMIFPSSQEAQRNLPVRTISSKALRVTPDRTMSGLTRQAPGRSEEGAGNESSELLVLERTYEGCSVPMRAASMNLAQMRSRAPPARSRSGMRQPGRNAVVDPNDARFGEMSGRRAAPLRAASMSVAQTGRRPPGRTISAMGSRRLPDCDNDLPRSVPERKISLKALRVTPERTVSGLRRQAPDRATVNSENEDLGNVTVLQRDVDDTSKLTPRRAASMNLSQMRRIASSLRRGNNIAAIAEPNTAGFTMPRRPTRRMNDGAPGGNASRTIPMRARSMTVRQLRVQRQESMSGLRVMAQMASGGAIAGRENDGDGNGPLRKLPARSVSSRASRLTPERGASFRWQMAGRRSSADDTSDEVHVLQCEEEAEFRQRDAPERALPVKNASNSLTSLRIPRRRSSLDQVGAEAARLQLLQVSKMAETDLSGGEPQRCLPARTSSAAIRRELHEKPISGMFNQRQTPARAHSVSVVGPRRQLPQRTTSGYHRAALVRTASTADTRQLPQRTSSIRQRITPVRTTSGIGARPKPHRTPSNRQRIAQLQTTSNAGIGQLPQHANSDRQRLAPVVTSRSSGAVEGDPLPLQANSGQTITATSFLAGAGPIRVAGSQKVRSHSQSLTSVDKDGDEAGSLDANSQHPPHDGESSASFSSTDSVHSSHTNSSLQMDSFAVGAHLADVMEASKERSSYNMVDSGFTFTSNSHHEASEQFGDDALRVVAEARNEGIPRKILSHSFTLKNSQSEKAAREQNFGVDNSARDQSAGDLPFFVDSKNDVEGPCVDTETASFGSTARDPQLNLSRVQNTVPPRKRASNLSQDTEGSNTSESKRESSATESSIQNAGPRITADISGQEKGIANTKIGQPIKPENEPIIQNAGLRKTNNSSQGDGPSNTSELKLVNPAIQESLAMQEGADNTRTRPTDSAEAEICHVDEKYGNYSESSNLDDPAFLKGKASNEIQASIQNQSTANEALESHLEQKIAEADLQVRNDVNITSAEKATVDKLDNLAGNEATSASENNETLFQSLLPALVSSKAGKSSISTDLPEESEEKVEIQENCETHADDTKPVGSDKGEAQSKHTVSFADQQYLPTRGVLKKNSNDLALCLPLRWANVDDDCVADKSATDSSEAAMIKPPFRTTRISQESSSTAEFIFKAAPDDQGESSEIFTAEKFQIDDSNRDGAAARTAINQNKTELALAQLNKAALGTHMKDRLPSTRVSAVNCNSGMPTLVDPDSEQDDDSLPPLDDAISMRDDESLFSRGCVSMKDDESMYSRSGVSIKDDGSIFSRGGESMPHLCDALSVRDDESMPGFDDVTSVRGDDESLYSRGGMSIKDDDESKDGANNDTDSVKEDGDSMPPLSDIASASVFSVSVRDDESLFSRGGLSIKDEDESAANYEEHEAKKSETIEYRVPSIINTCILKKQRIGPIAKVAFDGGPCDPGAVPPVIGTLISLDHVIRSNIPVTGETRCVQEITVINPYVQEAEKMNTKPEVENGRVVHTYSRMLGDTTGGQFPRDTSTGPKEQLEDGKEQQLEEQDASTVDGLQPPSMADDSFLVQESVSNAVAAIVFNRWS